MMDRIPDRENLESMSRSDIQKLCKDNNIKANMRTDEMINALCDLVNGKDVPRPHRYMSERVVSQPPPKSRVNSVQPFSKATEITSKKTALQQSESNTDAESAADTPAPVPTTRRKAKDLQSHLGKGRPVIAGGSGARNITKVISRGNGRKGKASAMLHEDPIPEEEAAESTQDPTDQHVDNSNTDKAHPSSVRPLSPVIGAPNRSQDDSQPSQLPTPAPSHPSYTWPSAQVTALECRVAQLETPHLAARLSEIEAVLTHIPVLKESVARIPALQDEIKHLEAVQGALKEDVAQWAKSHAELKVRASSLELHVNSLVVENATLKERITELDTILLGLEASPRDTSMSSVIIRSPKVKSPTGTKKDVGAAETTVGIGAATRVKPIVYSLDPGLPNPSPSQPTLGKRARSPTETPDVSLGEIPVGATQKQREDAELAAIHRVVKPQRKKARLALDPDREVSQFPFVQHGRGGPSSTSTPHQHRSDSPPDFFTHGRRAPTPLARTADDDEFMMSLDIERSAVEGADTFKSPRPSNHHPTSSGDAVPHTPPPKSVDAGPSQVENSRHAIDAVYDPGFFNGPLPVYFTPSSQLPFPLHPATPNPQDILERSTQFATPTLGEPWKFDDSVNPANISQFGDGIEQPSTPGSKQSPVSSKAVPPQSPGDYIFRAGGRKERNDKYNPYFTPPRGPGARHRTGITPTRGFSVSLKSPAKMETVEEAPEGETDDGVLRSPPNLRTLYGTELGGDTRFGDYGRDLGRYDWGKYVPR